MRLQINDSKNSQSLYVVKTVYFNKKKTMFYLFYDKGF